MIELKQIENKILRFSELDDLTFQIYDIEGYDFSENLRIPSDASLGVYIFTKREHFGYNVTLNSSEKKHEMKYSIIHHLLYCGKTKDIDNRFYEHNHKVDLVGKINCICIHVCNSQDEIDEIERLLLDRHNFKFNEVLNNWTTTEEVMIEEP